MARMAAFIVLVIPAILMAAGIKFMRDTLFGILISPFPWIWLQFVVGAIFFAVSFLFFAGFYCTGIASAAKYRNAGKNKTEQGAGT